MHIYSGVTKLAGTTKYCCVQKSEFNKQKSAVY